MKPRSPIRLVLISLAMIQAGCDYKAKKPQILPNEIIDGPLPSAGGGSSSRSALVSPEADTRVDAIDPEMTRRREVILGNVIKLMKTASTKPGGSNFAIATDHLNELFEQGMKPSDFALTPSSKDFLLRRIYELTGQDPEAMVKSFSSSRFADRDARHIEDCMAYHALATRIAGEGDDLEKVRRIFDWMVRHVLLVPAESLGGNGMRQARVRPADALFRGMATENGRWSERGWLFMALCRQIGVDVGLLNYTPRRSVSIDPAAPRLPVTWICAAVIDHKAYLFDQRLGIEITNLDRSGVATLEEAITDPEILGRLDLPQQLSYGTTSADLAGSPSRIGVLIDSSAGYFAPKMRLLQGQLRGEYRTILYRDPSEQAAGFAEALGKRLGAVTLWDLPLLVEDKLFRDRDFVAATLMTLQFFDSKYPLLYARTDQLRGELTEATDKYVAFRFAENAVQLDPQKTPIPPEIQKALDIYSTYFLAQSQLDRGNTDQAEYLYRKMLEMVPEPAKGRYFYYMFRWGAIYNLGRICEFKGDRAGAISFYTQPIATAQFQGNLIRARDLAWGHPFDPPAVPLPPAPPDPTIPEKAAAR